MRITNKSLAAGSVLVALILFGLATIWMSQEITEPIGDTAEDHALKLEYLAFKLKVYEAIGIGFLVALLGLLVPNILPEAKYEFNRQKEGRRIFSEAKTGIDYFRYELADLDRQPARDHIHKIHELKHLADTYIKNNPRIANWPYEKPYEAYDIIMAYLNLVEDDAVSWDSLNVEQRKERLSGVQKQIEKAVKKRSERMSNEPEIKPEKKRPRGSGYYTVAVGLIFISGGVASFSVDSDQFHLWLMRAWILFVVFTLMFWGIDRIRNSREDMTIGQDTINMVNGVLVSTIALLALMFGK